MYITSPPYQIYDRRPACHTVEVAAGEDNLDLSAYDGIERLCLDILCASTDSRLTNAKMVKQSANSKRNSNVDSPLEMPLWASKLIERFDTYSSIMQQFLSDSFDRILGQISDLQRVQNSIISRLSVIGNKLSSDFSSPAAQQNLIYSTFVKVRADNHTIDEKLRRITWIGIDEQEDEESTRRFDYEILKEAVYSSGETNSLTNLTKGQ
ncbi:hypothetical protein Y032_0466g1969 [Ancylostoma ceylanicum]|uniref:Uncharacterized protein n=1 Tax=Ancylostoma ceylanicum TaxID=53326 RepID=A0A016WX81_9BILA|nr:hypothetical protein Y032_0466g1969 [Ancylostoma ceylanicum]